MSQNATRLDPIVHIAETPVGGTHPPYIIAEAGVNHGGDANSAHSLIDAAKQAGANAVKFQVFSADKLVSTSAPACSYQTEHDENATSQYEMLRRLELAPPVLRKLKEHTDEVGLHFLATPFGLDELDQIVALGVPALKIASSDLVNVPLLDNAAKTGLPLIMSTGASTLSEIEASLGRIQHRLSPGRLILMHCVSAYPTQPDQACLRCIATLDKRFGVPVGFSDHTPETGIGALAVAAGAKILEKHITLDRTLPGPDQFFSLDADGFKAYVSAAHAAHRTLGIGTVDIAPEEQEIRERARGSLVTAGFVSKDSPLRPEDLTVQRPGDGIAPTHWDEVIGCEVKADLVAGTVLSWSMIR